MATNISGIQPVPLPPSLNDSSSTAPREWMELVAYRNRLVSTRNAQLEYTQTASHLYDKVRQACKDLSKKDNSVKEGMEVLSLERQRLGYLRDELSRRAEMLSRWEVKVREAEKKLNVSDSPTVGSSVSPSQKEADRMNALLLELEQRRKASNVRILDQSLAVVSPSSERAESASPRILTQEKLPGAIVRDGSGVMNPPHVKFSAGDAIVLDASDANPAGTAPAPFPSTSADIPLTDDEFVTEMKNCLEFIWREYSTEIGGENNRLMTLPNLMRLCADSNLAPPTQSLIELYIRTSRLGKSCLVEREHFLILVQSIVSLVSPQEPDPVKLTDILFGDYLMPLTVRLSVQQKRYSKAHPSLPRSNLN